MSAIRISDRGWLGPGPSPIPAAEAVGKAERTASGHAGLLTREKAFGFPPYPASAAGGEIGSGRVRFGSVILERFRHPRFLGELADVDAEFEDVNPLCGDRVRMQLRVANGGIADARFQGDSCAICTASADLLAEMVRGRTIGQVLAIGPDDLLPRLDAKIPTSRMTCVTLPLQVLKGALAGAGIAP